MTRAVQIAIAAALLLATACYTSRRSRPAAGGDQYLIIAAELESSGQSNLFDAVQRLRPFWLSRTVRGRKGEGTVAVYVDDQFIGTMSVLQRISVLGVSRVAYLSPTAAQTRFGQNNAGRAAIVVMSGGP